MHDGIRNIARDLAIADQPIWTRLASRRGSQHNNGTNDTMFAYITDPEKFDWAIRFRILYRCRIIERSRFATLPDACR
jgi:hypothetical protein